jgi:hypothetical protein
LRVDGLVVGTETFSAGVDEAGRGYVAGATLPQADNSKAWSACAWGKYAKIRQRILIGNLLGSNGVWR